MDIDKDLFSNMGKLFELKLKYDACKLAHDKSVTYNEEHIKGLEARHQLNLNNLTNTKRVAEEEYSEKKTALATKLTKETNACTTEISRLQVLLQGEKDKLQNAKKAYSKGMEALDKEVTTFQADIDAAINSHNDTITKLKEDATKKTAMEKARIAYEEAVYATLGRSTSTPKRPITEVEEPATVTVPKKSRPTITSATSEHEITTSAEDESLDVASPPSLVRSAIHDAEARARFEAALDDDTTSESLEVEHVDPPIISVADKKKMDARKATERHKKHMEEEMLAAEDKAAKLAKATAIMDNEGSVVFFPEVEEDGETSGGEAALEDSE